LLDTYVPDPAERHRAFAAVETIPSIRAKAAFCLRWLDSVQELTRLETAAHRRQFLLNLICFAGCVEGLFFFGAFAYVYFLRWRGHSGGGSARLTGEMRRLPAGIARVAVDLRRSEPAGVYGPARRSGGD